MKWLDRIPLSLVLVIALIMALAPFVPEPHLWQKVKMLFSGTLIRLVDIFDLFWHGAPAVILVVKLARMAGIRRHGGAGR